MGLLYMQAKVRAHIHTHFFQGSTAITKLKTSLCDTVSAYVYITENLGPQRWFSE